MDKIIRNAQLKLLSVFAKNTKTFALSGGTALELFYLKHRFSRDLDFFSPEYNVKEINHIITAFHKSIKVPVELENEIIIKQRARVRFYTIKLKNTRYSLKIDFIEDVLFDKPVIKKFKKIPVYDAKNIYFQKIAALVGTELSFDVTGKETITGRKEARDIVDIYYLSKKIYPLHKFLKNIGKQYQRAMVYWYRTFSRIEAKLGALELDIYDKNFDASEMIEHINSEFKKFIEGVTL